MAEARYGVVGWPVAHSLSPKLHNFWLAEIGLQESYRAFAVPHEPEGALEDFLFGAEAGGLQGLNITVPHKERAAALLAAQESGGEGGAGHVAVLDEGARLAGAVNTLLRPPPGFGVRPPAWLGRNTDIGGCLEVSAELFKDRAPPAVAAVLGAGGMAAAFLAALVVARQKGGEGGGPLAALTELRLFVRDRPASRARGAALLARFAPSLADPSSPAPPVATGLFPLSLPEALGGGEKSAREGAAAPPDLVLNATPLGLAGSPDPAPAFPPPASSPPPVFLDAVYGGEEGAPLARAAAAAGWRAADGRGLLAAQARLSFAAWFGATPQGLPDGF